MRRSNSASNLALALIAFTVLAIIGSALAECDQPLGPTPGGTPAAKDERGRPYLDVAYSPEKAQLFERLVAEFNKQNPHYAVRATKLDVDEMLTQATAGRFAAISPDSAIWLGPLDQAWLAEGENRSPIVGSLSRYALSPVVIAAWQSEAQKMGYPTKLVGWSDLAARATADAAFRWSHPSTTTAAGLLTTTAEFYAAGGKTSRLTKEDLDNAKVQDYVRRVERTIQQYGGESEDQVIARLLNQSERTIDAFVGQESLVVRFNRQTRGEKLVALYPREGTLWMDHPLVLLEGPWLNPDLRRAYLEFADFLRSAPMQRIVMQEGYRPADLGISLDDADSQIKPQNGVDPAQPQTLLQMPSYGVLDSIRNAWALLKRPANIYLVADVSGSMEGDKIDKAREAFISFVGQVRGTSDRLALATFATVVQEQVPLGAIGDNRDRLTTTVNGIRVGGNTALYDAVYFAAEKLSRERQTDRINAVLVMTDGMENASRNVRSGKDPQPLIDRLQALNRSTGVPVLVFTVAYGDDADFNGLQRVSAATRAQAYRGNPDTIRRLYQLLSAFFN